MDVSVGIISYNTKELLIRCLESIFSRTKGVDFEIIVVDNCSYDGTPEMLKELFPQVSLINNDENRGFSKAVNQAFKVSTGEFFLILNPDTEFSNNVILELFNFIKSLLVQRESKCKERIKKMP